MLSRIESNGLEGSIFPDLASREIPHGGSLPPQILFVPRHGELEGLLEVQSLPPAELHLRLGGVELQEGGLVRVLTVTARVLPTRSVLPQRHQALDEMRDRLLAISAGTEIPALGKGRALVREPLRQQQIARERFQHVLPGPYGMRAANLENLSYRE